MCSTRRGVFAHIQSTNTDQQEASQQRRVFNSLYEQPCVVNANDHIAARRAIPCGASFAKVHVPGSTFDGLIGSSSLHGALLRLQRQVGNKHSQGIAANLGASVGLMNMSQTPLLVQRASKGTSSLDELRTLLREDEEKKAIGLMGRLSQDEATTVLNSREFKELAISSFSNAEMYSAVTAMNGDLYQGLQWLFDEGTDWEKVRSTIQKARTGRQRVCDDNWMKGQFIKLCNDEEVTDAARLLGCSTTKKVEWMAEEGVNAKTIYDVALAPLPIPGAATSIYHSLFALPRTYRDDVALHFVQNQNDDSLKLLANNSDGRRLLVFILAELADGWTTGDEKQQRDRVMGLVEANGPSMKAFQTRLEKEAKVKQMRATDAKQLIKTHSTWLNLREEALARELLVRLPGNHMLVAQVLDNLESRNRDDVSLALFQKATDAQLQIIAADANGRLVLLRMVQELHLGDKSDKERAQMQRVMKLVSRVDHSQSASVEAEVITYLYGGSLLDAAGVTLAGGAKGHTAICIGDRAYSFEAGWSCGRTKDEYLAANRQKRDGIGQVLQLTEEGAREIQKELDASCGKGVYGLFHVCTDSTARALQSVLPGLQAGWNPQRFVGYLEATRAVKEHRFYPKEGR